MDLKEFLAPPSEVARRTGPQDRIVFSSRVRLARNLRGFPFPGWAKKADRIQVYEKVAGAVAGVPALAGCFCDTLDKLSALERQLLVERHLISREHAARTGGGGVVLNRQETLCLMINEEDHLRMQSLRPGLQLREAWAELDALDSALESHLEYAFSPEYGYLTACPTNVGTGIRVSAMLHLPGLVLTEQINPVIQSVNKLGLAVRGLYGEGTEALGNVFQVSNQMTLGESEQTILEKLDKVLRQIIEFEENARTTLVEKNPKMLFNHIGRAYGILANAHIIASKEAMNMLSLMRLGVDLGMFPGVDRSLTDELFLLIQPAHLQLLHQEKLQAEERDILRADLIRNRLRSVSRPGPPLPAAGSSA
jgi:protein arginine kinase